MANYRSLVGEFFATPEGKTWPVSIRFNNPGAVNSASWEKVYPGYVGEFETTPGNRSTVFETPEHGVAVWYVLMRKYADAGVVTVGDIIKRYGGGQDYSAYVTFVVKHSGLAADFKIALEGDDRTLLLFAKAMFRYEAGRETPLSDQQILYGFLFAREFAKTGRPDVRPLVQATKTNRPVAPPQGSPPKAPAPTLGLWAMILQMIAAWFAPAKLGTSRILRLGSVGADVKALQQRLHKLGFKDLGIDGEFGAETEDAIKHFQLAHNLDPDGEAGKMTIDALNGADSAMVQPPLLAPSKKAGVAPAWYVSAAKDIGFKESGVNQGIEKFIAAAHAGKLGDPWCAIFVNAKLEENGVHGSLSAMARSFEGHPNFVRLPQPALGCIVTMWRGTKASGQGHVFLYDGENAKGVRGIGANESDMVKRSFHDRTRIIGFYWPKDQPAPVQGVITVNDADTTITGSET